MAAYELEPELMQLAYEFGRNRVFSKEDIINVFLRAGVPVEAVDYKALLFIDLAIAEEKIRPLANKPGKYTRRV